MSPSSWFGTDIKNSAEEVLWDDGDRVVYRVARAGADGDRHAIVVVLPAVEHPTPAALDRLAHEYGLRDELDPAWAARPLEFVREPGQTKLVLEDPGGVPLDRLIGRPMVTERFLHLAGALSAALRQLHERGLIHKDIKPANVLVSSSNDRVWLTGFGLASRLLRERQSSDPPEFIAGTLAYMAPEQTGRMNRSIDSRSDLYSLGITLYQMVTGTLPFTASDPMEWVHCHVAKKPVPPSERLENVPAAISAIILKLLAKTAEERYQTAGGVERDLQRCLKDWEARGTIADFPLGQQDTPDRLLIPEKLYGRDRAIDSLLASFDRVVASGRPELVLVSGYSGIGKSSVVNELHKVLVPPRGLFAAGKFDQYKHSIPYATLTQAFQTLVRLLLSKGEAELRVWRDAIQEALGPNALLIVDLVPELKLIIGEQPPVPVLPPLDAQRRFQFLFRRFIGVFARPEHPLALFLDDLQWLDPATLDLLEDLLAEPDVRYLLLIGAYRDNEVDSSHPLMRKLEVIRKGSGRVQNIELTPLTCEDLGQMVGDSLHCGLDRAAPLVHLLHEKTAGNPFFAIQFLSSLAEEGLLNFEHREARWSWDLKRIYAKGHADNVVALMIGKLNRLPIKTQKALQHLACLGDSVDFAKLRMIYEESEDYIHSELRDAVGAGLVLRLKERYKFLHDRVQEAAYALIPENLRDEMHLQIGRLFVKHTAADKREEMAFEIVNHLNRGCALITSATEREQVAELNLIAGKRAKQSAAYKSALTYLITGAAMLPDDCWQHRRDLAFALEFHRGECEFLTGELASAEVRLTALSSRAADAVERALVACLRVDVYTTLARSDSSVAVCLDYLRDSGVKWSPQPAEEEGRREYERIWSLLGRRAIEELVDLPLMTDPASLATLDVLTKLSPPALYTNANLLSLATCKAVNFSLEHGNGDGSCVAYVMLGMIAGPRFGNYKAGFQFGRLAYELVERRGLQRFRARTYMYFANMIMPWTMHVRTSRELVQRGFDAANESGDLPYAAYGCNNLNTNLLMAGDALAEVQREAKNGLEFAVKTRSHHAIDHITVQLQLVRTLRGLTTKFGFFNDEQFDELGFERHLSSNPLLALPECWYWIRKLQARFLAKEYSSAVQASENARRLLWTSPSRIEIAEFEFYSALAHAASYDSAAADRQQHHLDVLTAHYKHLEVWSESCPENFENRAALVAAEIARIEGGALEAERLYEKAIRSAHANGFFHNEALANEIAARFYAAHGFEKIAVMYLRDARYCYLLWGADGKVRQLDELYPQLCEHAPVTSRTNTIEEAVEHLDLATILKVLQVVSGPVVLEKLIDTVMRTAIEQAGAQRGLLVLSQGAEHLVAAEAIFDDKAIAVQLRDETAVAIPLPESILQYVLRTQESVILEDALAQSPFAADPYIQHHRVRSVLCLPLLNQTKLIGVLYLENNLAPRVFAPARISVLKVVASQAAISLENTRLYRHLAEREAKIRRLVEANIIGIIILDFEGHILEANDAFLRMLRYDRADLVSGRLRWTDLTPPEWKDELPSRVEELIITGTGQPHEKEYFRKDGSRVPVLVGGAILEGGGNQAVAFVLDLTDQKKAERGMRESEERYRATQSELARVSRIATMGQLSASIAHEINQPVAAAVTNATTAWRWLGTEPPNVVEARKAIDRIIVNGVRAGEVIGRIRSLAKKAPPKADDLQINEAILEVMVLIRGEIIKNDVLMRTQLSNTLPAVRGDRVQLQQVMLNLIINAVEAMKQNAANEPRELYIRSEQDERGGVLVAVQDTGPGFSPESAERLFDAFYTTKPDGLGIGLSICRSIIEAHVGRLWATADQPRGATFQFTVPTQPAGTS